MFPARQRIEAFPSLLEVDIGAGSDCKNTEDETFEVDSSVRQKKQASL